MDTGDYDAHYDKTGENPGGDPADVVAGCEDEGRDPEPRFQPQKLEKVSK